MGFVDRLLTIVVTATLTSAAWLVAGGTLMKQAEGDGGEGVALPNLATASGGEATSVAASRSVPARSADREDVYPPDAADGTMVIPVSGVAAAQLSDTYTQSRSGGARLHEAIDIMAATGTPVVAAAPGKVEKLFLSEAGGKTIYVRSADGRTIYYYAHLDQYQAGLAEGQQVAQGARLGTVGSTGNASPEAPHLHFAVMRTQPGAKWWEPASAVNPYPLLGGK